MCLVDEEMAAELRHPLLDRFCALADDAHGRHHDIAAAEDRIDLLNRPRLVLEKADDRMQRSLG